MSETSANRSAQVPLLGTAPCGVLSGGLPGPSACSKPASGSSCEDGDSHGHLDTQKAANPKPLPDGVISFVRSRTPGYPVSPSASQSTFLRQSSCVLPSIGHPGQQGSGVVTAGPRLSSLIRDALCFPHANGIILQLLGNGTFSSYRGGGTGSRFLTFSVGGLLEGHRLPGATTAVISLWLGPRSLGHFHADSVPIAPVLLSRRLVSRPQRLPIHGSMPKMPGCRLSRFTEGQG